MRFHTPVLLQSVIEYLAPQKGKLYIDATAGGGGHTQKLLEKGSSVLAIDRDPEAIEELTKKFQIGKEITIVRGNFSEIGKLARDNNFDKVDGILFDLGASGHQFENAKRGFSIYQDGPLDMRMDPALAIKAEDIINNFSERRLNEIFKTYGQEKFSRSIASAIYSARQIRRIETTRQLAEIIEEAVPRKYWKRGIHPATKSFQALRIVVNSEFLNLEQALPQTPDLLGSGGRLAIISFHSLEDAIVKRFFKEEKRLLVLTKKPVGPQIWEIQENPRARSARLRVAERI